MTTLEDVARAAIRRDALALRAHAIDYVRSVADYTTVSMPNLTDRREIACTAALVELFAARAGQSPPVWTAEVVPISEPFYLLESAQTLRRLRRLCEDESPEPLRKRNFFAPPNFLESA